MLPHLLLEVSLYVSLGYNPLINYNNEQINIFNVVCKKYECLFIDMIYMLSEKGNVIS